jgi:hypothetical protein
MSKATKLICILLTAILGGAALGAVLSALMPGGFSLAGFAGAGVLTAICLFVLILAWKCGGGGRILAWMMILAFLLRLVLGVGLSLALPVYGYDTPTQNAGYIFLDAYQRDQQAWQLAASGQSLLQAFGDEFFSDQYGGMLAVSAAIYRFFSPDGHRPWLVLILTAAFGALGVPFLRRGLSRAFEPRIADAAVWIFLLYPEGLLLGGSQMRDQILIGLSAAAFWGALALADQCKAGLIVLTSSIFIMALFSWLVAAPVLAVLLVLIWIRAQAKFSIRSRRLAWLGIALLCLAGLALMANWLRESAIWDAYLTEQGSGWLQLLFKDKPQLFKIAFLVIYGFAQPVLPAAIFDPSLPLWNGITTFRSLGWYFLLPTFLYLPFGLRNEPAGQKKNLLILAFVVFGLWTFISSLRAGGDLWDNPRYRSLFILWLAMISAWGWISARERKDPWLIRWFEVEAVFLVIFSIWYANRTFGLGLSIPFYGMIAAILILAAVILGGGALIDIRKARRKIEGNSITP